MKYFSAGYIIVRSNERVYAKCFSLMSCTKWVLSKIVDPLLGISHPSLTAPYSCCSGLYTHNQYDFKLRLAREILKSEEVWRKYNSIGKHIITYFNLKLFSKGKKKNLIERLAWLPYHLLRINHLSFLLLKLVSHYLGRLSKISRVGEFLNIPPLSEFIDSDQCQKETFCHLAIFNENLIRVIARQLELLDSSWRKKQDFFEKEY